MSTPELEPWRVCALELARDLRVESTSLRTVDATLATLGGGSLRDLDRADTMDAFANAVDRAFGVNSLNK